VASLLLALVVSQTIDRDSRGDAVQALVIGGTAGAQQAMINFTRENEYEADRKGLELMKKAGYPAIGMAEFFSILGGEGSNSELANIEFLRTHPVSENRMGEAYQFKQKQLFDDVNQSNEYDLFKVYINALVGGNYKSTSKNTSVIQYKKALDAVALNQFSLGVKILQTLYEKDKDNLWVAYKLADLYIQKNSYIKALGVINHTLELYPQQSLLLTQKVKVLMLLKKFNDAKEIALFELNKNKDNKKMRYSLVTIYEELNDLLKAREVEGDYMLNKGSWMRAKYLYKQVLNKTTDSDVKKRLQQKVEKTEHLENLEKERKILEY